MPRLSQSLLQALPSLRSSYAFTSSSPAIYSVGVSYAGKDSPPFVHSTTPYARTGFAGMPTGKADRIRQWVRDSGNIPAGRGELESGVGGWSKESMERVGKWGAGEDFFALEGPNVTRSVRAWPDALLIEGFILAGRWRQYEQTVNTPRHFRRRGRMVRQGRSFLLLPRADVSLRQVGSDRHA